MKHLNVNTYKHPNDRKICIKYHPNDSQNMHQIAFQKNSKHL